MPANKISVVFPGQGSQSTSMLDGWLEHSALAKDCFEQASSLLGYDLVSLIQDNPNNQLNQTEYTQVAIYTTSAAIWLSALECFPIAFSSMAGHSLGEYTALMAAGAISFEDGLKLVHKRGQLMQSASPDGAAGMTVVIGLKDEVIDAICTEIELMDLVISPANYNAPGQTVVAGVIPALERFETMAKAQGAKIAKRLPMSVPSHSPLLSEAVDELAEALDVTKVQMPSVPVYSNVTGHYHDSPDSIKRRLKEQIITPVHWVSILKNFEQQNVTHQLEIGPGKVLTGLAKRSLKHVELLSIVQPSEINPVCQQLQKS